MKKMLLGDEEREIKPKKPEPSERLMQVYQTMFDTMTKYDQQDNENPLSPVAKKISLSKRQDYIVAECAEQLGCDYGGLLSWLLEMQLKRIRQFVGAYRFNEQFLPDEEEEIQEPD